MITPADIAAAALTLTGARYQHHGRGRDEAEGLDCAGVLVATFRLLGATLKEEPINYPRLPPEDHILRCLALNFAKADRLAPAVGDVVHIRYHRDSQARHLGIIVPGRELQIVHALRRNQKVICELLRGALAQAEIVGIYQWPN